LLQSAAHASDWLNCFPVEVDLPFSSQMWQYLLRWRLGLPLVEAALPPGCKCPKCFQLLDPDGDHFLSCAALGTYQRHNAIRDNLVALYREGGYDVEVEVSLPNSSDRQDVFVHALENGVPTAIDVSAVHALQLSSNLAEACNGTAMAVTIQRKLQQYQAPCKAAGWNFRTAIAETTGAWSKDTHTLLHRLSLRMGMRNGTAAEVESQRLWHRLSLALVFGVAQQLSRGTEVLQRVRELDTALSTISSPAGTQP